MNTAAKRNAEFQALVEETSNTSFGRRLLELRAFAKGAGCLFRFDSTSFELWTRTRKLYSTPR